MHNNNAIKRAYNAAELKADEARNGCGPAPIDHAAQAALENSDLSGDEFTEAYEIVFKTIHGLSQISDTTDELADKIRRVKYEV